MALPEAYEGQLDDHSERLRGIEKNNIAVASQLASQSVQIDGLGKTIELGIETLARKFDDFTIPVSGQLKTVIDTVDRHGDQIKTWQDLDKARDKLSFERRKFWAGIAKAIIVGIGSIGLEKLGVWLWGPVGVGHWAKGFFG